PGRGARVLGYPVSAADVGEVFQRLGIATSEVGPDMVEVEAPGYRVDLEREIDLIEEVVRLQGYDRLPLTVPGIRQAGAADPTFVLRRWARTALMAAGMRESISLSFASEADLKLAGIRAGVA